MTVAESQLPPRMLECARQMYEAFIKNMASRGRINRALAWWELSQEVRDDWCAAAVAAFQFVAEGAAQVRPPLLRDVSDKEQRVNAVGRLMEQGRIVCDDPHRVSSSDGESQAEAAIHAMFTQRLSATQPLGFKCDVCHEVEHNPDAKHERTPDGPVFRQIINGCEIRRCDKCRQEGR